MSSRKADCNVDVILIHLHQSPFEACYDFLLQRVQGCHQALCYHRAIRSSGTPNPFHREGYDGWMTLWYAESASVHGRVSTPEDGFIYASPFRTNAALQCRSPRSLQFISAKSPICQGWVSWKPKIRCLWMMTLMSYAFLARITLTGMR